MVGVGEAVLHGTAGILPTCLDRLMLLTTLVLGSLPQRLGIGLAGF